MEESSAKAVSVDWFASPGRFSIANLLDLNNGAGFCGKPWVSWDTKY